MSTYDYIVMQRERDEEATREGDKRADYHGRCGFLRRKVCNKWSDLPCDVFTLHSNVHNRQIASVLHLQYQMRNDPLEETLHPLQVTTPLDLLAWTTLEEHPCRYVHQPLFSSTPHQLCGYLHVHYESLFLLLV